MNEKIFDFDIPQDRLFLDKVGFQFPSIHLNGEVYRGFAKGPITILKWGNTSRVLVHDEYLRTERRPAEAVFNALVWLSMVGVFDWYYATWIQMTWRLQAEGVVTLECALAWVLLGFEMDELELTIDLPGIEYLAAFKPDVFKQVKKWTFYTKGDFKRKLRGKNSRRAGESKGVQKSFFTAYRKDLQIGLPFPMYRLEFRFSGRYRNHISENLLFLTAEEAYSELIPSTKAILKRLKVKDSMEFNPLVTLFPESPLGQLLRDLDWFGGEKDSQSSGEGGEY